MVGKNRLVMVLSYLESIEDPYQYGDNYGDLVEYLKMLIEGEEEYVPEGKKYTLSWMQKNEYGEWETKSKLVNWEDIRGMDTVDILQSGILGEATRVSDMRLTESSTRDSWAYNSKHKYFTKENKPTKWSSNTKDKKSTKHGIIIEGSFDREDYLTDEDQAVWGLNPHSILTALEFNERRLDERADELTKKLNNIIEETDLVQEEYAHARWKKGYKNKDYHTQIQAILKKLRKQGVHF